jgi:cell division initiation protein
MAKITAVDIQHKSFKKSLQGYDRAEVDQFLDELIESLEDEAQARAALEVEISDLRERISHFKAMEDSLQNTLLLAQRTADEVKAAAHHKAHLVIEEARVAAERETGAIDSRISDARREFQHALELAEKAKSELRSMLVMYMNLLDKQLPSSQQGVGYFPSANMQGGNGPTAAAFSAGNPAFGHTISETALAPGSGIENVTEHIASVSDALPQS